MNKIHIKYCILISSAIGLFLYLDYIDILVTYDDTYSANLIQYSFADIIRITSTDVHPPLYYWGLKTYSAIFGTSMFALRSFSALGMMMTVLLGYFPIRRLFGLKVSLSFILLIIIFPVTQYLVTEIRMYSWCMFFVLASGLFAYDVYQKGRLVDWAKFFLTSICAAYLHNYGLISVFWIYILLFIFMYRAKKDWKYLIVCGILFSIAYLPWLFQLLSQLGDISASYWIKPLTLNDLFLHIYYLYSPKEIWYPFTYFSKIQMMLALIALMTIQLFVSIKVISIGLKQKNRVVILALLAFVAFLLPIATGFIYSIIDIPVMVTRYMTCSFGLFLLSLAIILVKALEYPTLKKLSYLLLLLLFVDGGIRFYTGMKYYDKVQNDYTRITNFVNPSGGVGVEFFVNDYSWYVLPRVQRIVQGNTYSVIVLDSLEINFQPFEFDVVKSVPSSQEFILLHEPREIVQENFYKYQQSLQKDFIITDSLSISDIIFYKMKPRIVK